MTPLVLLSAGGTGGHLFPAEALALALEARGARVALATDERVGALSGSFPAETVVQIPSGTPSVRSPLLLARAALRLGTGTVKALAAIRGLRPAVAVGFGGYPTVPPLLAATLLRVPAVLHEQNGVMGRANRLLAGRAALIATGFPDVRGVPAKATANRLHTGNPIRPAVREAAGTAYLPPEPGGALRLLVFGGSQGARVMSDIVPPALERLSTDERARLRIVQQVRLEDRTRVRDAYDGMGVEAELQAFFADLPRRMAEAHLVVSRSGASTVAELSVIGRPAILVPLPGALDQDQAANAATLGALGAATVLPQAEFTPERLAAEIAARLDDPQGLTRAAAAAKSAGRPDAAERLADAVLALARA